ncbi:uncharacterized protein LOC62_05G007510 [Vanrija pseudolonga]|uniref:Uncharacterized protein n=1 Tax=Vanrija pseudolonga TaxID=143232 RepID=A0AAF0YHG1_9TREE|nr:hypothetical protein LOC62_05G007510 [Vanrija pseudolonga]
MARTKQSRADAAKAAAAEAEAASSSTAAPNHTHTHTHTLQELYPNLGGVTDHYGNTTAEPVPPAALARWEAHARTYPRETGHGIIIPFSRRADKVSRVVKYFSDPNPAVYLLPYSAACNRCVHMSWFCFRKSPAGPCLTCRNEKNCRPNQGMEVRMLEPAQKRMLESKGFVLPPLPAREAGSVAPLAGAAGGSATPAQRATKPSAASTKRRRAPVDTDTDEEEEEYRPSPKRRGRPTQRVMSPLTSVPPSDAEMSAGPSHSAGTPAADHASSLSRSPTRLDTPAYGAMTDDDVARFIATGYGVEGEEKVNSLMDQDEEEEKDELEDHTDVGQWHADRRPAAYESHIADYPTIAASAHSPANAHHYPQGYPYTQQLPEPAAWGNMTREMDHRGPLDSHSPHDAHYGGNVAAHYPDEAHQSAYVPMQHAHPHQSAQYTPFDMRPAQPRYPNGEQRHLPSDVEEKRKPQRLFTAPNPINRGGHNELTLAQLKAAKSEYAETRTYTWHAASQERKALVYICALLPPHLHEAFVEGVRNAWTHRDKYEPPQGVTDLVSGSEGRARQLERLFLRGLSLRERTRLGVVAGTRFEPAAMVDLALRCMPKERRALLIRAVHIAVNDKRAV